jgi:hypothetical protein
MSPDTHMKAFFVVLRDGKRRLVTIRDEGDLTCLASISNSPDLVLNCECAVRMSKKPMVIELRLIMERKERPSRQNLLRKLCMIRVPRRIDALTPNRSVICQPSGRERVALGRIVQSQMSGNNILSLKLSLFVVRREDSSLLHSFPREPMNKLTSALVSLCTSTCGFASKLLKSILIRRCSQKSGIGNRFEMVREWNHSISGVVRGSPF